jgi:hypothetical protein
MCDKYVIVENGIYCDMTPVNWNSGEKETPIAMQWLSKHVSPMTNIDTTITKLLEAVFYVVSAKFIRRGPRGPG